MKLLVLGGSGMAGHTIAGYFTRQGNDVTGFDRNPSLCCTRSVVGDARETDFLRGMIRAGDYDAVINCIGILNQAAEDNRALASFLNAYFPHFLAETVKGTRTMIVHMSTDCVFSGKRGGYTEDDLRDGETFYDRSKALGELDEDNCVTLRNSIVGPDLNPAGIGLLNWFMQQQGEIKGFTKALWTGMTTLQLAKTMEAAIQLRASGLYNTVPDHAISKYDLLLLFNRYLRGGALTIRPNDSFSSDKSLKRTRFAFPYIIPDYEEMVSDLARWMDDHQALYPHYYR